MKQALTMLLWLIPAFGMGLLAGMGVRDASADAAFREEVLSRLEDLDSAPPPDACQELLAALEDATDQ